MPIEQAVGQAHLLGEGKVQIEPAVGQARLLGEGKVLIEPAVGQAVLQGESGPDLCRQCVEGGRPQVSASSGLGPTAKGGVRPQLCWQMVSPDSWLLGPK